MDPDHKNWTERNQEIMKLKPLGWIPSLLIFLGTATVLRVTHYNFAPAFQSATGQPYLIGYLIGWCSTMFLIFLLSLIMYKLDGHPLDYRSFVRRYRLEKLEKRDWLWLISMIVVALLSLISLSFTQPLLRSTRLFGPHPLFPPDMVEITKLTPGMLFGMTLKGKWWLIGVYLLGWFFNIVGEELWYRGWMLPRQEAAFGKYAWVINGLMFNFQHTFQPWNLLAMLPGSLFISYAVQRRKKTWLSILWHGLLNFSLFLFILQGVIGLP
jgi:membrane protease YdiL (CAAX protease family)